MVSNLNYLTQRTIDTVKDVIKDIGADHSHEKAMHLAAIAYHLKKYVKFEQKRAKSGAGQLALMTVAKSVLQNLFQASMTHRNLDFRF